jgi:glycosyltransferase involved in cell wall biosynthesis
MTRFLPSPDGPDWRVFDADWYRDQHREELAGADGQAALAHYQSAAKQSAVSPNPYFSEAWYRTTFPDVAALIKDDKISSGFAHYQAEGFYARSPHWLFSEGFYRTTYRELTNAFLADGGFLNGYDHFLRQGDRALWQGSLFFDPRLYLRHFVPENGAGPFAYFARQGFANKAHHRLSWYFDDAWYAAQFGGTVAASCGSMLEHYLTHAEGKKNNPSPYFSEAFYAEIYPDIAVAVAAGKFRNGFDHFIQHGIFEQRQPHPDINLEDYFRNVSVQADIEAGLFRDAFAHFSAHGGILAGPARVADHQAAQSVVAARARNVSALLARRGLDFSYTGDPVLSVLMQLQNDPAPALLALQALRLATCGQNVELVLVESAKGCPAAMLDVCLRGAHVLRPAPGTSVLEAGLAANLLPPTVPVLLLGADTVIEGDAVAAAQARLESAPNIGAVGGKILSCNGQLQAAGGIVWRDGSCTPYLCGAASDVPEANFTRDVDFCASAFLLLRAGLPSQLAGFGLDGGTLADAGLCLDILRLGFRVVYDPAVAVTNIAGLDAGGLHINPTAFKKFQTRHADFLALQPRRWDGSDIRARHARSDPGLRILLIEDRLPFRGLGAGYTRTHDLAHEMARMGHHVTLFPVFRAVESQLRIWHEFASEIEVIHDRELPDLPDFLAARPDFYDVLWLARTQNAARVLPVLQQAGMELPGRHKILDTEAIAALRDLTKWEMQTGQVADDPSAAVHAELEYAPAFDTVIAVNEAEAQWLRRIGLGRVKILGHVQKAKPTAPGFEERQGLLFVGALHDVNSPNLDSLHWFVENVLPRLEAKLGARPRLTVAGYVNQRLDLTKLSRTPGVYLRGPQEDLTPLYASHRVFIAPARFAAGIPYKLHEAAAFGIPMVATPLLAGQLGWETGTELLTAKTDDGEEFAAQIVALYTSPDLWRTLRMQALARVEAENSPALYEAALRDILETDGLPLTAR